MKQIALLLNIILMCSSCKDEQKNKQNIEIPFILTDSNKNKKELLETENNSNNLFLKKIKMKESLTDRDYLEITKFLTTNNDEALSEEAGYTFYKYFKQNDKANLEFKKYLEKSNNKITILNALIQIMCLDLGEDNYTNKKLEKDFIIFNGEAEPLKQFEICINQF